MAPRGNNQGLDFTPVLTHYLFLGTTILAVIGWFTAFIGQIVSQAQGFGVGVVWFSVWLQLFLIIGVVYTLASDSVATHRFQISTFGAIAIVFAVLGVNEGIFSGVPALDAMAAGWLLLAIVDILWVLYFTSEEDSLAYYIFNSMGNGGLSSPSRRRRTQNLGGGGPVGGIGGGPMNNGYGNAYSPGGGIGSDMAPYDPKPVSQYSNGGIGSGSMGGGVGGVSMSVQRRPPSIGGGSMNGGSPGGLGQMNTGAGSAHNVGLGGGPGSIRSQTDGPTPNSPLMGASGAPTNPTSPSAEGGTIPEDPTVLYRAKALYAYTASPDDPNEISFNKNEILDIIDKQGKWWQARKADGSVGIAPSNYLQII